MTNQDGQLIKDITATLRGDQPQPLPPGAFPKTRHPGSQNLGSTRPALTRSSARAGVLLKQNEKNLLPMLNPNHNSCNLILNSKVLEEQCQGTLAQFLTPQ